MIARFRPSTKTNCQRPATRQRGGSGQAHGHPVLRSPLWSPWVCNTNLRPARFIRWWTNAGRLVRDCPPTAWRQFVLARRETVRSRALLLAVVITACAACGREQGSDEVDKRRHAANEGAPSLEHPDAAQAERGDDDSAQAAPEVADHGAAVGNPLGLSLYVYVFQDAAGSVHVGCNIVNDSNEDILLCPVFGATPEFYSEATGLQRPLGPSQMTVLSPRQFILLEPRAPSHRAHDEVCSSCSMSRQWRLGDIGELGAWRNGELTCEVDVQVLVHDCKSRRFRAQRLTLRGTTTIGERGIPTDTSRANADSTSGPEDERRR